MSDFREIKPEELQGNVFDLIGRRWMLVTAGTSGSYNTMTASWGGLGVLWGKPVSFVFIRPQRHTLGFMQREKNYTLSFFDEQYRDALNFCGSRSGRDFDKAKETGLTPVFAEDSVYFSQSNLVIVCKKLYTGAFSPELFNEPSVAQASYPNADYHKVFIGGIEKILVK